MPSNQACLCICFFLQMPIRKPEMENDCTHFFYNYFVEAVTRTRKKKKRNPLDLIVDECDRWGDFETDKHHAYSTRKWKWKKISTDTNAMPHTKNEWFFMKCTTEHPKMVPLSSFWLFSMQNETNHCFWGLTTWYYVTDLILWQSI